MEEDESVRSQIFQTLHFLFFFPLFLSVYGLGFVVFRYFLSFLLPHFLQFRAQLPLSFNFGAGCITPKGVSTMSRYSFSLTTFNPSGALLQIEHALAAVARGDLAVGVRTRGGIALASLRHLPPLSDATTMPRTFVIDTHVGCVYAGLGPDARVLVTRGRKLAQAYRARMESGIPPAILVHQIAIIVQEFTQSRGVRPFGVSLLVAGFDSRTDTACLYQLDPSGAYWEWKAGCIGDKASQGREFLEKRYDDSIQLDDAAHLGILVLKEGFERRLTARDMDIALLDLSTRQFTRLTSEQLTERIAQAA